MNIQIDQGLKVCSLLIQMGGWELYSLRIYRRLFARGDCYTGKMDPLLDVVRRIGARANDVCMDIVLGKVVTWRELYAFD